MAITLKQLIAASAVALAAAGLCAPACAAPDHATHPKATKVLKAQARHRKAQQEEAKSEPVGDDEPESEITDTVVTNYACELNNKVVIYTNDKDDGHIALRWKNHLHRLERIGTTTGAQRFENPKFGLIWIGIPGKGILLDSKLNRQLANECKPAESRPQLAAAPAEKKS